MNDGDTITLDTPLTETYIVSSRLARVLPAAGITTFREVCAKTEAELLALPGFGPQSLTEVRLICLREGWQGPRKPPPP